VSFKLDPCFDLGFTLKGHGSFQVLIQEISIPFYFYNSKLESLSPEYPFISIILSIA